MRLETIDPKTLTLTDMISDMSNLYYLHIPKDMCKPVLTPMSMGSVGLLNDDSLIVRIIPGEDMGSEPVDKKKQTRSYEKRTYAYSINDPTETIYVEFRPTEGDIRVNFKDKEIAEKYFNYFREQFYTSTTGASVITVSNIYKDLNLVNWNPDDCDDWGWYTLDNGTCRYITEVMKTRNTKLWGFTLKKPTKLYETKKKA